jgi:hypothetical protein
LNAAAQGLGRATLERRIGAGVWKSIATVSGARVVGVEPRAHTLYRLVADGVTGPVVPVDVAPRLSAAPAGATVLAGDVEPATRGPITVLRRVAGGWTLVARPRLDASGAFRTSLKLHAGTYRVQVGDDGRYAATTADVKVTSRLLASFGS